MCILHGHVGGHMDTQKYISLSECQFGGHLADKPTWERKYVNFMPIWKDWHGIDISFHPTRPKISNLNII